jgi:hypothetical protein
MNQCLDSSFFSIFNALLLACSPETFFGTVSKGSFPLFPQVLKSFFVMAFLFRCLWVRCIRHN